MRLLLLLCVVAVGCGWKPKPYARDPMGRLPLREPGPASLEPLTPAWPAPPTPPLPD